MADCIFCKIVAGEVDASIELETDSVVVFKNINPAADVHLLIVPKKHIASFGSIDTQKDRNVVMDMVEAAQAVIKKANIADGFKLNFNGGKYLAIDHLHWHLLGGEIKDLSKT